MLKDGCEKKSCTCIFIGKEDNTEDEARPVRKTVHQIKLPPLNQQSLVSTLPPEDIEDEEHVRIDLIYHLIG